MDKIKKIIINELNELIKCLQKSVRPKLYEKSVVSLIVVIEQINKLNFKKLNKYLNKFSQQTAWPVKAEWPNTCIKHFDNISKIIKNSN